MEEKKETGLEQFADIRFLDAADCEFSKTEGGFLALKLSEEEQYPRVSLMKAFPFTRERGYISIRNVEGKEIGMIRDMDAFPPEVVEMMEYEIHRRYFSPVITSIRSIKDEFGYCYWDVVTEAGPCRFTSRSGHNNIVAITEQRLMVIDVDGNRFEIPDYSTLDAKSMRIIETYL